MIIQLTLRTRSIQLSISFSSLHIIHDHSDVTQNPQTFGRAAVFVLSGNYCSLQKVQGSAEESFVPSVYILGDGHCLAHLN
jgi:hypothetical protein